MTKMTRTRMTAAEYFELPETNERQELLNQPHVVTSKGRSNSMKIWCAGILDDCPDCGVY